MWYVGIGGVKYEFYTTSLQDLISVANSIWLKYK